MVNPNHKNRISNLPNYWTLQRQVHLTSERGSLGGTPAHFSTAGTSPCLTNDKAKVVLPPISYAKEQLTLLELLESLYIHNVFPWYVDIFLLAAGQLLMWSCSNSSKNKQPSNRKLATYLNVLSKTTYIYVCKSLDCRTKA